MKRALAGLVAMTLAMTGDGPPEEFRIFVAGQNETRKGPVLFDAEAARLVMAAYEAHGVDLMIDLEHLSLDDSARNFDPDARGWCQLEVRNGELWAVNVRWTPDGELRLKEKRQRYISPAFAREKKTGRAIELVNIAITAMPATDHLEALVAASARAGGSMFNAILLAALGVAPEADDKTAADAMAAAMADPTKMLGLLSALLDAKTAAEGEGEAMADKPKPDAEPAEMKAASGAVADELALEVMGLRAKVEAGEVRALVEANRQKLSTPALERWALSQTPKALAEALAVLPESAPRSGSKEPKKKPPAEELTAEERKLCRLTGRSEADLLKHKTEQLAASSAAEED